MTARFIREETYQALVAALNAGVEAANGVTATWESGDLAAAVRQLDDWCSLFARPLLDQINPALARPSPYCPKCGQPAHPDQDYGDDCLHCGAAIPA